MTTKFILLKIFLNLFRPLIHLDLKYHVLLLRC